MSREYSSLLDRLLENDTVLMPDRNVFQLSISLPIARAVVLDLDDYASDFTQWEIMAPF